MPRVAIYARYSSDNQRDASIEDQIAVCRRYAERQGWTVVDWYADRSCHLRRKPSQAWHPVPNGGCRQGLFRHGVRRGARPPVTGSGGCRWHFQAAELRRRQDRDIVGR